jgi:hypothetical protein
MGIAREGHHLAWHWKGGWCLWLPDRLKRWIIGGWNHVACTLWGHGHLVQDVPLGPCICTDCCRVVRHPDREPIRTWDDDED